MKNKHHIFEIIVALVAIAAVILLSVPIPIHMDKHLEAMQYKLDDPNYSEKVDIHVEGKYSLYLVKQDTFMGNISIDKYPQTVEKHLVLRDNDYNIKLASNEIGLSYGSLEKPYFLGTMLTDTMLNQFIIKIYEHGSEEGAFNSWSHIDGIIVVTKLVDRQAAIDKLGV